MSATLKIDEHIIKIVGVFSYDIKKDIVKFKSSGFDSMKIVELPSDQVLANFKMTKSDVVDGTRKSYKNTYYKEFRGLMLTGEGDDNQPVGVEKKAIKPFSRKKKFQETLKKRDHQGNFIELPFVTNEQELFLFPDGIGIFSISVELVENTIGRASDLTNQLRSFNTKIFTSKGEFEFHQWITENVLSGISLVGDKIEADEYSGSKFKVYSIFDISEQPGSYNRDHLLFELGTSSRLGTIQNNDFNSPSSEYYDMLMQDNKLSAFNNYEGLALLDSFTVIGTNNLKSLDSNYISYNTWNRTYFSIYIFNLYVRYNLFRYNAQFLNDPVKYRDKFEYFLNHFNFKHISFNFLPNMIFAKMRVSLGVEDEIEQFEKRLKNLAQSIQEQQEKKQAFLLTLISVISAFDAVGPIVEGINNVQQKSGLSPIGFYGLMAIVIIIALNFLVQYLFPLLYDNFKRKLKKRFGKRKVSNKSKAD
jgi:hypothetical protein